MQNRRPAAALGWSTKYEVRSTESAKRTAYCSLRTCARLGQVLFIALLLCGGATSAMAQGVPVAARDLQRGATLRREDIDGGDGEGSGPVGWVTRRVIAAGEALREPAIMRPNLVRNGDVVQLVWKQGSVELRLVGRAMGSAARGERVQVRVDSRRRFVGVVIEEGLVRMEPQEGEQ